MIIRIVLNYTLSSSKMTQTELTLELRMEIISQMNGTICK
jgi:hypothetical protein